MIGRRFTLWQKAAALAPALLLLVCLPAQAMLRCRIDGLLRTECCCGHQEKDQSPDPVVKAQDCCDHVVAQSQRPTAEAARSSTPDLPGGIAVAVVAPALPLAVPATERFDRAMQRHGPAREGPTIILLKQAFLI